MSNEWIGWFVVMVALVSAACPGCAVTDRAAARDETGFVTLFDGKSMDGWDIWHEHKKNENIQQDAFYIDAEGNCVCKAYNFYWWRYKAREFGDFILRLDFKVTKDTNSGVCLRTLDNGVPPPFTGFEVQILDDYGKPPHKHSCGAIYDVVAPSVNASRPAGQWNQLEITCKGHLTQVALNGQRVIDADFSKYTRPVGKFSFAYADLPRSGYIAFQDHGFPVWYRNVRIKPL